MKEAEFRHYLKNGKQQSDGTISSRLSNLKRIERYYGNLDEVLSGTASKRQLLSEFEYSKDDETAKLNPRHRIPITSKNNNEYKSYYEGTATLHAALLLYDDFLSYHQGRTHGQITSSNIVSKKCSNLKSGTWPDWEKPSLEIIIKIAKYAIPFIRFLSPEIVEKIVYDNEKNIDKWKEGLQERNINPDYYLWSKGSCIFPGVRRYSGREERNSFRDKNMNKRKQIQNALDLDDNDYPKQIWSFLFRNKQFQKEGPPGYSLAHLLDHKDNSVRHKDEIDWMGRGSFPLFGLYTSAANTIYIPSELMRLTDFNIEIRLLLFHKAQSLYGEVCNIIPPGCRLKDLPTEIDIEDFEWAPPIQDTHNFLPNFINWRNKKLADLFRR